MTRIVRKCLKWLGFIKGTFYTTKGRTSNTKAGIGTVVKLKKQFTPIDKAVVATHRMLQWRNLQNVSFRPGEPFCLITTDFEIAREFAKTGLEMESYNSGIRVTNAAYRRRLVSANV